MPEFYGDLVYKFNKFVGKPFTGQFKRCPFYSIDHFAEEEKVGCFTLIVLWLSVFLSLPHGEVR